MHSVPSPQAISDGPGVGKYSSSHRQPGLWCRLIRSPNGWVGASPGWLARREAMIGERPRPFGEPLGRDVQSRGLRITHHRAGPHRCARYQVSTFPRAVSSSPLTSRTANAACKSATATPASRQNWIAALDRLAALNPTIVVAGHKKPGAPASPSSIQATRRYLQDVDQVRKLAKSDQERVDQLTQL